MNSPNANQDTQTFSPLPSSEPIPAPQPLEENLDLGFLQTPPPSSMRKAILGGLLGVAVSATLWTIVTVLTGYSIGYAAVGVGFLVGILVKFFGGGGGNRLAFGILASVLSCLAFAIGDIVSLKLLFSKIPEASNLSNISVWDIYKASLNIKDLLFYGLAIVTGFKTAT